MTIVGVPAFELRTLFRERSHLMPSYVARVLSVSAQRSGEIMIALEEEGFLKKHDGSLCHSLNGELVWELTTKGCALRIAKAGAPIKRSTADRLVAEFLVRVNQVNADAGYAYRIGRVVVFGSYLGDRADLGDIDLGVDLVAKWPDEGSYEDFTQPRIAAALKAGRRFSSYITELTWPETEIWLLLKNRSRALSLTPASMIPEGATTKLIYEWRRT